MIAEKHVFTVDNTTYILTAEQRHDIEASVRYMSVQKIAKKHMVTVDIVMHVWNTFRAAHKIPAIMI